MEITVDWISENCTDVGEYKKIQKCGNRTIGENFKLSGDCADCCEPWEICSWPCPDALTK